VHILQCIYKSTFTLPYQASAKTGVIFKQIRKLLDDLLQQKLENPSLDLTGEHHIEQFGIL